MRVLRGLGFFVATVLLYLGVPLLGWGLGHLRGFAAAGERLGYAIIVVAFALAVGYQAIDSPEGIRGRRGQEAKLVPRQTGLRFALVIALYAVLFLLPFAERRGVAVFGRAEVAAWLGLALVAPGFGLVYWSGVLLGRQYSADVTIQEQHQLIASGVYAYVRHPRYLGVILLALGVSLVFRSWAGLLSSLPLMGGLLFRIRDEEALMHREFGDEWEAYCRHSWRLVPFLF